MESISVLACLAAGFFIMWLVYRAKGFALLPRLILPYFIGALWRYVRKPGLSRWGWTLFANVGLLAVIAGMIATYNFAGWLQWPSHNWNGWRFNYYFGVLYWVSCEHPFHLSGLWLLRWMIFVTFYNFYSALFLYWEDCRAAVKAGFAGTGFVKGGAVVDLLAPFTYLLRAAEPFTIDDVFKKLDAIQRVAKISILAVGNAPPSGVMVLASRKGLPVHTFSVRDLPGSVNPQRFCFGLAPVPVYWDFARKPHIGIVGPSGDGKSNLARSICAAANMVNPNTFNIFIDIDGVDWQLREGENMLHVSDVDMMLRVFQLVEEERLRRVRMLLQGGAGHGMTDIGELADQKRWTNPVSLPRIFICFDEFAAAHDLFGRTVAFKKAMELFRSFVTRARKYGISVMTITTRADFDTLKSARDVFRWLGVGSFRERAGAMVFEQEIRGWNVQGSFRYELEAPFEGLGVGKSPLTRLSEMQEILTGTAKLALAPLRELSAWFHRERYRVQQRETLEKVEDALTQYLAKV